MRVLALLALSAITAPALDHSAFDALVKRYVTAEARVDYAGWKGGDVPSLDAYLATLGAAWPADLTAAERKAAQINAYNALVIRWILENFPVKSIWQTKKPFVTARHRVNGRQVSLDDVENALRDLGDPRVHAVLVCAALSCPPLRREAYVAERLDEQMDSNTRAWLANPSWNRFLPGERKAEVSSIFDWFRQDFERNGGSVTRFLAKYAPGDKSEFLRGEQVKIKHVRYDWGLNDTSGLGERYGRLSFYWDWLRNRE